MEKRLDMALCNQRWLTTNSILNLSTLNKLRFDHYPLLLEPSFPLHLYAFQFKFLSMWSFHDNFEDFIAKCWFVSIISFPTYILSKKLQLLKKSQNMEYRRFGEHSNNG